MLACPQPVAIERIYGSHIRTVMLACKRYDCESCTRGRQARLAKHLAAVVDTARAEKANLRFITFTYPLSTPADVTERDDVVQTSERFRRVVQTLRRQGVRFEYARVLEATKRGRIHIHALVWGDFVPKCHNAGRRSREMPYGKGSGSPCYCNVDRPCIQRAAHREGFGWVDVRRVKSKEHAQRYVLKYIRKQIATGNWPRHARRYSYSRDAAGGLTLRELDSRFITALREKLGLPPIEGYIEGVRWGRMAAISPVRYAPWRFSPQTAPGSARPPPQIVTE